MVMVVDVVATAGREPVADTPLDQVGQGDVGSGQDAQDHKVLDYLK